MKIAIVNISKPAFGTGDKITEYTYQLYKNIRNYKDVKIDLVYAIEETKRNNVSGLIYTNTLFKRKISELAKKDYDIIHITNQEIGFAAKLLKNSGCKAKIITTIHDTMRLRNDLHRGLKQKLYNTITAASIRDAMEDSDYILFDEPSTAQELRQVYDIKNFAVTPLGVRDWLVNEPIKRTRNSKKFVVGYLGPLDPHKNLMLLMDAAKDLGKNKLFSFEIYGSGPELDKLMGYKTSNNLENVDFKGLAVEEDIKDIYDNFDSFVFPAVGESYSLTVLEAMARGLPIIINKSSALIEEIRKHCYEVKSSGDLKNLLVKLAKDGYDKNMKAAALAYSRSLTWDKTAKETFGIYRKVVNMR